MSLLTDEVFLLIPEPEEKLSSFIVRHPFQVSGYTRGRMWCPPASWHSLTMNPHRPYSGPLFWHDSVWAPPHLLSHEGVQHSHRLFRRLLDLVCVFKKRVDLTSWCLSQQFQVTASVSKRHLKQHHTLFQSQNWWWRIHKFMNQTVPHEQPLESIMLLVFNLRTTTQLLTNKQWYHNMFLQERLI